MHLTEFISRESAASATAELISGAIQKSLASQPRVTFMASGGSSPRDCLKHLSGAKLDWSRVDVTLTDERRVPVTDNDSNEKLLRETLFRGEAKRASFLPLEVDSTAQIAASKPVSLVGMGEDGHFASIFPDLKNLALLTSTHEKPGVFNVQTGASPVPRRTVNLALLARSSLIVLLVFGEEKKACLSAPVGLPVQHLLELPGHIYWAP